MDNNTSETLIGDHKQNINSLNSSSEENSKVDINKNDYYTPQSTTIPNEKEQTDQPYDQDITPNKIPNYNQQDPFNISNESYKTKIFIVRMLTIIIAILLVIFVISETIFLIKENKFLKYIYITTDEIMILICAIFFLLDFIFSFINKKITQCLCCVTAIFTLFVALLGMILIPLDGDHIPISEEDFELGLMFFTGLRIMILFGSFIVSLLNLNMILGKKNK